MSTSSYKIRVFTPAGLIFETEAVSVRLPSVQGEIGILPQHASYSSLLGTDILQYQAAEGAEVKKLVVSGGFINFSNNVLTLLADSVDLPDEISAQYASARPELLKTLSENSIDSLLWQNAKQKLMRIESIERLKAH